MTDIVFQRIIDFKFGSVMVYYMFIFVNLSYITKSLTQKTPFSETYSNVDFRTDSVNNLA